MDVRLKAAAGLLLAALGLFVLLRPGAPPALRIVEIMPENRGGLRDEDGDSSDWIEILNRDAHPVDLEGFVLTDVRGDLQRWTFPKRSLAPDERLLVFASGKDRRPPRGELHTNFRLKGEGEFLALLDPRGRAVSAFFPAYPAVPAGYSYGEGVGGEPLALIGAHPSARLSPAGEASRRPDWTAPTYDDAGWDEGVLPLGYDLQETYRPLLRTDLAGSLHDKAASLRVRVPFEVARAGDISRLRARLRYDDGVVLWMNGERLLARDAVVSRHGEVSATEVRPDSDALQWTELDLDKAIPHLRDGTNVLAIQLANAHAADDDLLLDLRLTAWPQVEEQAADRFFALPTPGRENGVGQERVPGPVHLEPWVGLSTAGTTVSLAGDQGEELRYTLDGTLPDAESPIATGPQRVRGSTRLQVRAMDESGSVGPLERGAFLELGPEVLARDSNLPIAVLSTLGLSVQKGQLVEGLLVLAEPDHAGRAALSEHSTLFPAAFQIRGSSSSRREKASYAVELRDRDDHDDPHSLLGLPAASDWVVYGAYNFDRALLRNTLMYAMSNAIGRYAPRTRFIELYLHTGRGPLTPASYAGVYALIEKPRPGPGRVELEAPVGELAPWPEAIGDAPFMVKRDRLDPGDSGFRGAGLELGFVSPREEDLQPDQRDAIIAFFDAFEEALARGMGTPEEPGVERFIDVDAWIDYHLLQELSKNPDAHHFSALMYRPRGGRLVMGPQWDFDRAFGADDTDRARNKPNVEPLGWSARYNYGWWEALLRDPVFTARYRARWLELRQGPLSVRSLHALIDAQASELREAQARNFERWPIDLGENGWEGKVQHVRDWLATRLAWIDEQYAPAPAEISRTPMGDRWQIELRVPPDATLFTEAPAPQAGGEPTRLPVSGPLLMRAGERVVLRARIGDEVWSRPVAITIDSNSRP